MTETTARAPGGYLELHGHEDLRERIRRATRAGRLPQSLLFHGSPGVGKQRLALWTGALLLCPDGGPCGRCRSCRLAARLEHPDLHWHFPLPRPKRASTRAKERERLEESRLEELARRREDPYRTEEPEGPTGIYLAAVETIRAQAARRPAMGERTVFVLGRAEALVPQAANPEAANALLKLLEEPPPYLHLILTSARPAALLPTIRSRALSVRVPPLAEEAVERLLKERIRVEADQAGRLARLAQGSPGEALRLASGAGEAERRQAEDLLRAALSPHDADRLALAACFSGRGARGAFSDTLAHLQERIRDLAAVSAGRSELALGAAPQAPDAGRPGPGALARAAARVDEACEAAAGNQNPQAIVAALLFDLHRALEHR